MGQADGRRPWYGYGGTLIVFLVAVVYCYGLFVNAGRWLPVSIHEAVYAPRRWLLSTLGRLTAGGGFASREWTGGAYLAIVGIVLPWSIMALLGRGRPSALGVRMPNRFGVVVFVVAYLASLPFLYWMVTDSGLANYYLPHMRRAGTTSFLTYYAVNMLGEHFFLHGVLLAALRPGMRWPELLAVPSREALRGHDRSGALGARTAVDPVAPERFSSSDAGSTPPHSTSNGDKSRRLKPAARNKETGNAPSGPSDVGRWSVLLSWLRLPRHCWFAVLGSAALFALVHVGKDPRELVLSAPGGVVLAYLAYRTNSFLTPFVLHLATAGTALGMMVLFE